MNPIKTHEHNFVFLGPGDAVADLPCRRQADVTYCTWEPTQDERRILAGGGRLRLGIHCVGAIPPVSLAAVADAGPDARVPAPCTACGKEPDDPVHGTGPRTHAYRLRGPLP